MDQYEEFKKHYVDILNGDRIFLNRYIDDVIRKYYIEEYDKKHKEK